MLPNIYPKSNSHTVALPEVGNHLNVNSLEHPLSNDGYLDAIWGVDAINSFIQGCVEQVTYTFRHLGGAGSYIELTEWDVYESYLEACLEASYLLNIHQAKNSLSDVLGNPVASFDSKGNIIITTQSSPNDVQPGDKINLRYQKFNFSYPARFSNAVAEEVGLGGTQKIYKYSVPMVLGQQEYNLQKLITEEASTNVDSPFYNLINSNSVNNQIIIKKVYYQTIRSQWKFYGFYNPTTTGNLSTYGQFADDSTFEIVPVYQNKLQAAAYKDSLHVRTSHYSYEIRGNILRIFPPPRLPSERIWVEFVIPTTNWEEDPEMKVGINGVNNIITLPFGLWEYTSINQIGKRFIQKYALGIAMEMLGRLRSKFSNIPIPNDSISLNGDSLISSGKEMKQEARDDFKETLDQLTYVNMMKEEAEINEAVENIQTHIPLGIYRD